MKLILSFAIAAFVAGTLFGAPIVKNGHKIAFLGDSITQQGRAKFGYNNLVIMGLARAGIKATPIHAGISGHKAPQMSARLEKDIIKKKPDFMTLSCGVNDVWHGKRGTDLATYKKLITSIVDRAAKANIKVIIMTASMIREDQKNILNRKLIPYNDFLRNLAKERKLPLADINLAMQKAINCPRLKDIKGPKVTYDGVHMNGRGNIMMALEVLRAMNVDAKILKTLEKEWLAKLNAAWIRLDLKDAEHLLLIKKAKAAKMTPENYLKSLINK